MVGYNYVVRDGERLEVNVAYWFDRMNQDFIKDTGYRLHVSSGTRLDWEQEAIFRDRYVLAGDVRGRRVYDTRWWGGRLWYRISSAGTVAVPGNSNHQESGPNGPRSIDIRDSGSDAGVTTAWSARDMWMRRNAWKYGFENEGDLFGESWHKTFRWAIGGAGPAVASLPASAVPATRSPIPLEDDVQIITATTGSEDGLIKAGHSFVNNLTAPLSLLSAAEVNSYRYWSKQGIPFRDTQWSGDDIRAVVAVRGLRPFDPESGRTDYSAAIKY